MATSPAVDAIIKVVKIPQAVFGLVVITLTLLAALGAPWIVPVDPEEMDFEQLLVGISAEHLLGSDQMGRDTLARLIYGARNGLRGPDGGCPWFYRCWHPAANTHLGKHAATGVSDAGTEGAIVRRTRARYLHAGPGI